MPPRSPLPPRHGLGAAWLRTPDSGVPTSDATLRDFLLRRLPSTVDVDAMLASGEFVDQQGHPICGDEPARPNTFIWFHRRLREEPPVPFDIPVLYQDERIVVVDKPPFLSTIPRGRHVVESVVVKLRARLGLPELAPAHRLDRLTSGVLLLTTHREYRAGYQRLFEQRAVTKVYTARAAWHPGLLLPHTVRNHLVKRRGVWQAEVIEQAPWNAETHVELLQRVSATVADYRLRPTTGRTHQLRRHLNDLGAPILHDPLYPTIREVDVDDFSHPLELIAAELSFLDPHTGQQRVFHSQRSHPLVLE